MKWTDGQIRAITEKGSDILVSAAAGSGKTAVLVERIIRRILDKDNPADIDRMLVVTFTEAAAAEMKEKIIRALKKDGSARANRQIRLAGGADITTIDSFCLRCVKNNFHNIGIDPDFGICDSAESELIRDEACDALFDSFYSSDNSEEKARFIRLTRLYSSNRNDYGLKELVLSVHKFAQSFPEPQKWIEEKAAMYDVNGEELFLTVWIQDALKRCKKAAGEYGAKYKKMIENMTAVCGENMTYEEAAEIYPYCTDKKAAHSMNTFWGNLWNASMLGADSAMRLKQVFTENKSESEKWDSAYELLCQINGKGYFPQIRSPKEENEFWEKFRDERKEISEGFKSETAPLITRYSEEVSAQFETLGKIIKDIVWLVEEFDEKFMSMKLKKGVFEFSDIEHMTYKLFGDKDIRKEYTDKYDEILIDEYQDTNGLQDAIFRAVSKNNIFMVGDLKQSIYRFRGGDPFIFKDKSARYAEGKDGVRIALSQNFRSRMEILDSVNSVFGCVMSDTVGDVVYRDDEVLSRENDYYTENGSNHKSEFHMIPLFKETSNPEMLEAASEQLEAAHIAKEIRRLIDEKYKVMCGSDEDGNPIYRDIKSSDVTILMSSVKNAGDIYTHELAEQGIDAYVENEGYFDRREVQLVMSLIKVIDNCRRDIPLIAVMRSPIGGFDDRELAEIRIYSKNAEYFYDAVCGYYGDNKEIRIKCAEFIKKLDRWREYTEYKSVAGLLWALYEESGFYDFMGAFEGGEEAQANLRLLYERAKNYEETGFKGLFNFIRYTERLKSSSENMGSAKIIGENHDVVRIMTIHKSKGLEFPVVFLAGCGKRFPQSRAKGESKLMNMHKDAGFGMRYVDAENSYFCDTAAYDYIRRINALEQQSENLRRLYVALTRPKEKLIVTSVINFADREKFDAAINTWRENGNGKKMPEEVSARARGFFDWLIPVALNDEENWDFNVVYENLLYDSDIYNILNYSYPYEKLCRLPAKTTVTEIKRRNADTSGYSIDYSMVKKPVFAQNHEEANVIGTAHHQIMAYIDIRTGMDDEYIKSETRRICENGQISEEDIKNISPEFIRGFFESDLGRRMADAYKDGRLWREAPFEISIDAEEYEPCCGGDADDEIIVQGTIDCFFEEADGVTLIDYKTDAFKEDISDKDAVERFNTEKAESYAVQLELYRRAVERITGMRVKEKYLYLFSTSGIVKVD